MLVERISKPLTWGKVRFASLGGTFAERAARSAMTITVVLGLWLRCRGYLFSTISLWLDEAAWARFLLEKPLIKHVFRPIGFMAVTKGLTDVFSPSETVLRFLPWSAGIATTLMAPFLARRLFRSEAARLLFVAVLVLDPSGIDLSKEFKPYAVGIALHAGILLLALKYSQTGQTRDLAYLLALVLPASLFAQDVVFAYPGVFLLVAIEAFRERRYRHLAATGGVGAATALLLGACYFFMWRYIPKTDDDYWGRKYDVFYVEAPKGAQEAPPGGELSGHHEAPLTRTDWIAGRYAELAKIPGERRILWTSRRIKESALAELQSVDGIVWAVLNFAGIALIAARRLWRDGLLLVLPLATMALFNLLGFWPFGPFRANAFVVVYLAGIASVVFDRNALQTRLWELLPATGLVFFPLFAFEREWHRQKEMNSVVAPSDFATVVKELVSLQGASYSGSKEMVIADNWSCDPWRYYTKYNPRIRAMVGGHELKRRFGLLCRKDVSAVMRSTRAQIRKGRRAWIIASNATTIEALEHDWPDDLEKAELVHVEGGTHLVIGVTRAAPKPERPPPVQEEPPSPEPEESGSGDSTPSSP
jgi:hypothetical protein